MDVPLTHQDPFQQFSLSKCNFSFLKVDFEYKHLRSFCVCIFQHCVLSSSGLFTSLFSFLKKTIRCRSPVPRWPGHGGCLRVCFTVQRETSFTTMQPTFSSPEHSETFDSRSHTLPTPGINKINSLFAQSLSTPRFLSITISQNAVKLSPTHCSPCLRPPPPPPPPTTTVLQSFFVFNYSPASLVILGVPETASKRV